MVVEGDRLVVGAVFLEDRVESRSMEGCLEEARGAVASTDERAVGE